jgi:uncharacterized protein YcfJ
MHRTGRPLVLLVAAAVALPALSLAQQSIIYPAKGQSAKQQEKDQGECEVWAKEKTGVDPLAIASEVSEAPQTVQRSGERVRGAARGALAGAAVGAVAGDAGKGAGIGAAGGVVAGGVRQRNRARTVREEDEASRERAREALATFQRAYRACLEGRGYTVK